MPSRILMTGVLLASSAGLAIAATPPRHAATTPPPADTPPSSTGATPDQSTPAPSTTDQSTSGTQTGTSSTASQSASTGAAATAPNPTVGGAAMSPAKTIVDNASAASNLSTLVSAVKAAGLDSTLAQPGPYTVFAPTNAAFQRLAPGTVDTLLKPENKSTLTKVLTYHVVPGVVTIEDLKAKAAAGGGKVTLTTVEGEPLTVSVDGQMIALTDSHGNKSYVETGDVRQSNGIVHVVNGVVLPKLG
ncbi:MAG: fasciclin domain-containing protein [Sphingomonas sp.]